MIPSHYDYRVSISLSGDYSFYQLLLASIRNADSNNLERLTDAFPEVVAVLQKRYNAPGGLLSGERGFVGDDEYECLSDGKVILVAQRERRTSHE